MPRSSRPMKARTEPITAQIAVLLGAERVDDDRRQQQAADDRDRVDAVDQDDVAPQEPHLPAGGAATVATTASAQLSTEWPVSTRRAQLCGRSPRAGAGSALANAPITRARSSASALRKRSSTGRSARNSSKCGLQASTGTRAGCRLVDHLVESAAGRRQAERRVDDRVGRAHQLGNLHPRDRIEQPHSVADSLLLDQLQERRDDAGAPPRSTTGRRCRASGRRPPCAAARPP